MGDSLALLPGGVIVIDAKTFVLRTTGIIVSGHVFAFLQMKLEDRKRKGPA